MKAFHYDVIHLLTIYKFDCASGNASFPQATGSYSQVSRVLRTGAVVPHFYRSRPPSNISYVTLKLLSKPYQHVICYQKLLPLMFPFKFVNIISFKNIHAALCLVTEWCCAVANASFIEDYKFKKFFR